jgi:RimJ/RimL family protein N-acetyltransferase
MEAGHKERVLEAICACKQGASTTLGLPPVRLDGRSVATLEPVTWQDEAHPDAIVLLARWREAAADGFPSQFPVTLAGTQRWLRKALLEVPDRVLFWVRLHDGTPVGHVGLFRFDAVERAIEIDNIVRGVQGTMPGIMLGAVQALVDWAFTALGMETLYLRVFSHNARAIRLYERCGFHETMRIPVAREVDGDAIRWVEVDGEYRKPVSRYFVTMRLPRVDWARLQAAPRAA